MILTDITIHLPLENSTLIFAVVLLVILFSPLLLRRLRIPYIVGLIFAGILLGPKAFNILANDQSFHLFGNVGILYILFLAGIDMDMNDFRRNRVKGMIFGMFTFSIPIIIGSLTSYYILHFSLMTSLLLAAMYSSQTLVAYPITGRYGVSQNRAVNITVGGTILTDTLMLMLLAVIAGLCKGTLTQWVIVLWVIKIFCFGAIVIFLFPVIARAFMKRFEDNILQFIFVLALVFLGAFLAQLADLEGVLGAFLVGIALNRLVPKVSPLKHRLEFVGNALFIPFFLIGVGMMIDYRVLFSGYEALLVAAVMAAVAITSKWLAATFTRITCKLTKDEGLMIFGLSNAHAVATLAAVMVGYNIILGHTTDGAPVRLLNDHVLNGTIIMILLSCIISSFVTEKAARRLALSNKSGIDLDDEKRERILIPVSNPETLDRLMELAMMMKAPEVKQPLYVLAVVDDTFNEGRGSGEKLLERAAKIAAATDNSIEQLIRYDVNVASGIIHSANEHNISDIVIGLHRKTKLSESFLGQMSESLQKGMNRSIFIYQPIQPIGTTSQIVIFVPQKAELELGFQKCFEHIYRIAQQADVSLVFYVSAETEQKIRILSGLHRHKVPIYYQRMQEWKEIVACVHNVKSNDLVIFIAARKSTLSYNSLFEEMFAQASSAILNNSQLIIYPEQFGFQTETDDRYNVLNNPAPDFEELKKTGKWLDIFSKKRQQ
jgi:Kef-type K+ transport system membrane component KefB/nucleotide-binding universal stress UspA family protein